MGEYRKDERGTDEFDIDIIIIIAPTPSECS